MKKLVFISASLFLAFAFTSDRNSISNSLQASGINFSEGNLTEAMKKASAESKSIFVFAYAEWSGPCKRMVATTFANEEVISFLNANFVNVKMECENADSESSKEAKDFIDKYSIKNYPVVIVMDKSGKIIKSSLSVKDNTQLMEFLKS